MTSIHKLLPLFTLIPLHPCMTHAQYIENAAESLSVSPSDSGADEAKADKRINAKELFRQGLRLMADERWKEAEQLFHLSNQEVNRPSSTVNIAICLVRQGRFVEGLETLTRLQKEEEPIADSALRQRIVEIQTELQSMIGTLEVAVSPESALITLDTVPTSQAGPERLYTLNPGIHELVVSKEGFRAVRLDVSIDSGRIHRASVHLSPERSADDPVPTIAANRSDAAAPLSQEVERDRGSGVNPWPWITAGLGGALLVSATVLSLLADEENQKINEICPKNTICDDSDKPKLDELVESRDGLFLAADISSIVGIVGIGTGVAWWLFDSDDDPALRGRAELSRRHIELKLVGRF